MSQQPNTPSYRYLTEQLAAVPRLDLVGSATPLERLDRLSDYLGHEIYMKRDDLTPLALGGNKLRKLEFLAAEALRQGADTLVTAGAIQSNHVRQTAAVAARLGLHCVALLESPFGAAAAADHYHPGDNYQHNGNRLLLDLFNTEVVMCDALHDPQAQLREQAERLEAQGFRPYVIPVGGSNGLGALGYIQCALEIAQQAQQVAFGSVVVASGSAGTHAGLAVGLQQLLPESALIGVTVSRKAEEQQPKVAALQQEVAALLSLGEAPAPVTLWDDYFGPRYGVPSEEGMDAIKLLAAQEGILLDPVYTGKAMAGLIDGLERKRFAPGPILFVHTGGAPALFAYPPQM